MTETPRHVPMDDVRRQLREGFYAIDRGIVLHELDALLMEAADHQRQAKAIDDWTADESGARHQDYLAGVCLHRAKMLERLADFLLPCTIGTGTSAGTSFEHGDELRGR